MKSKIYPRPLDPIDPSKIVDVTVGMWLGRVAGAIISAAIYAAAAIWFFSSVFNSPSREFVAIGIIGAGVSLVFSMAYISSDTN